MKGAAHYFRKYIGEQKDCHLLTAKEDDITEYLKRACFMQNQTKIDIKRGRGVFYWPDGTTHYWIRIRDPIKKDATTYSRQITIESMPPTEKIPKELEGLLTNHNFELERFVVVSQGRGIRPKRD
jgi:hypothetical protein